MLSRLDNIKLGPKMIGAFVVVALIATTIGLIGYTGIDSVGDELSEVGTIRMPSLDYLSQLDACQQAVWVGERGLFNTRMMDSEVRHAQYEWIDDHLAVADEAYKKYVALEHNEDETKLWKAFEPAWAEWLQKSAEVVKLSEEKDSLIASGVATADARIVALDDSVFDAAMASRESGLETAALIDEMLEIQRSVTEKSVAHAEATAASRRIIMLAASALGLLLAVMLGVLLSRSISSAVQKTVEMITEMSKGHLGDRLKLERQDEIGELAQTMDQFADGLQGEVIGSMQRLAAGEVDFTIEATDERDEIAPAINATATAVQALVKDARTLADAAIAGRLKTRADASEHNGQYRAVIEGVNDMMDAIVTPLEEAGTVLERAANRDLTQRVEGDYEGDLEAFADNINRALNAMDESLGQVAAAIVQVAEASGQISSGSQQLAEGSAEQASSLEEVSSSLEELGAMTRQNAGNAGEARTLSDEAAEGARKGNDAMKRMSGAMDQIQKSSEETAKIVKTIDEIAFQTNLLALNAAVEAARAGDAGKGFAVVAEEVRNLAQRSAEAAKDTADMIEEAVKNAEGGVTISHEVAEALIEIATGSTNVNELVAEIAAASDEQAQGLEQINTAVGEMDTVTQNNAANSEESASAAEELSAQAQELRGMVETFRLTTARTGSGGTALTLVEGRSDATVRQQAPTKAQAARAIPLDDDEDMAALSSF